MFEVSRGDALAGSRLTTAYDTHRLALEKWVNTARVVERCGPCRQVAVPDGRRVPRRAGVARPHASAVSRRLDLRAAAGGVRRTRPAAAPGYGRPPAGPPPDATSGRGSAGSAGCSRPRPPRRASTSPAGRTSTPPISPGRSRSAAPTSGRRSTSWRPARCPRCRRTSTTPTARAPRRRSPRCIATMVADFDTHRWARRSAPTTHPLVGIEQLLVLLSSSSSSSSSGFSGRRRRRRRRGRLVVRRLARTDGFARVAARNRPDLPREPLALRP